MNRVVDNVCSFESGQDGRPGVGVQLDVFIDVLWFQLKGLDIAAEKMAIP